MQALRTFETILQFRQGDVRLAANLLPEPLMHGRSDSVRSSSPPPWSVDLAGLSSPCRNLLGPTHTDPELLRDFLQRPFAGVISLKELSPQIIRVSLWHRDRAENRHPAAYLRPPVYEFTEKALMSEIAVSVSSRFHLISIIVGTVKGYRRGLMTIAPSGGQDSVKPISGISVPDTKLTKEITEFIRDTETELLFNHSSRVYYFGALAGKRQSLKFDAELLYAGVMFHDLGLMPDHSSPADRFEVDGANGARNFLQERGIPQQDIDIVWTAIALHTTPGIPQYMHPVIALVTAGVEMDVLGLAYAEYPDDVRNAVVSKYPRTQHFKEDILQAFYNGIHKKPDTTFGNVKADVLADKDPTFRRGNFCSVIRNSAWVG